MNSLYTLASSWYEAGEWSYIDDGASRIAKPRCAKCTAKIMEFEAHFNSTYAGTTVTVFKSAIAQGNLTGIVANFNRIKRAATTVRQYQKPIAAFASRPTGRPFAVVGVPRESRVS